ncbi:non-heme iron oxygenase ferredoxin subunit [Leptospira borgpetersenii]|uniref:Nitrite reductase [NAD(P)H], small subunit n=1 Tax=Leptospira borgpetersenii serovar Hardjo-bovis (strain JB197) TaxID=355277 RepID=Q04QC5_LEPBJ|nr:non-heme iron oxygenase ferredoxin subunit [Leptospira borgpetersenii]ABJ76895.1 Nitrite reductase [NAD(P)H], small subunit [Leptospira borgpetersenii serovar Hardjo-bovis str. JB197]AMX72148.1 benzene 1,2-dioxygenase [Leptospira borgpetersenii serovar Hardjo]
MSFRKLANLSEVENGKVKVVETRYNRIGITSWDGNLYAFEDVCTHDGEAISEGKLCGDVITCPRHEAQFSIKTGKALCMPAVEDLPVYPVRIVGDSIEVDLED